MRYIVLFFVFFSLQIFGQWSAMPGNYSNNETQVSYASVTEGGTHVGSLMLRGSNLYNGLGDYFLGAKYWKGFDYQTPIAILADVSISRMDGCDSISFVLGSVVDNKDISVSTILKGGWQTIAIDIPVDNRSGRTSQISFNILGISSRSSDDVSIEIHVDNIRYQYDTQGNTIVLDSFGDQLTEVDDPQAELNGFVLSQNYPNPFNPSTTIRYQTKFQGDVSLVVYNIIGREVAKLIDSHQSAGTYKVNFDASSLPSGTYIYRLKTKEGVRVKKMTLIK